MEKTQTSLRIPVGTKERLDRIASESNLTLTDVLLDGAELRTAFSPWLWGILKVNAKKFGLPVETFVKGIVLARLARDEARRELSPNAIPRKPLLEFSVYDGGRLEDEKFFEILKGEHLKEMRPNDLK